MATLTVESFTFDPRPNFPLLITAKRYRPQVQARDTSVDLTIVLAHATGFHKEHWEPTVEELWSVVEIERSVSIREVWSIDCPNHGDAAVLNESTLQWGYEYNFGWTEYARALHLFLAGLGRGLPSPDYFQSHNLVGIGHSMGAIATLLTLTFPNPPHWHSIILVEPMLFSQAAETEVGSFLVRGAEGRRDIWPSKDEAYRTLMERKSFKVWDSRVLGIYCEHGLRELPTADCPDKTGGMTLKCSKIQEAACYRDRMGRVRAYNYLAVACSIVPVHAVYGAVDDYIPAAVKNDVIMHAAEGRFTSVRKVAGSGHLVVQTHPKGLANAIYESLLQSRICLPQRVPQKSKL